MSGLTRTLVRQGKEHTVTAPATVALLDVVRQDLGLKAVPRACTDQSCGCCRVLLDGRVVSACALPWSAVPERATLEVYIDVAGEPAATRAIAAFEAERPTRCSLCIPALGVTAVGLARQGLRGDAEAIEAALEHASCGCTGRRSLRLALLR